MAKYWNCSPGDQLGKFVGYRVAWVPSVWAFGPANTAALVIAYAGISDTGLVRRASASELGPGDRVLVVDLLPTVQGQTTTVAQLANAMDGLDPLANLYSIEKIEESDIAGNDGVAARQAYREAILGLREKESILPKISLGLTEAKYTVYAVIFLVLLFLSWKVISAVRAK